MNKILKRGRDHEIEEIVTYERAVEVARLLLGKLDGQMKSIFPEDYKELPRRQLKSGKHSVRDDRRKEIERFCKNNFQSLRFEKLARLYEPLYKHGSYWRLPLTDLVNLLGVPRDGVLRGAPLHATVSLSPLGIAN